MRRSLVLTNESARHPLRSLIPMVKRPGFLPNVKRATWDITKDDVRGFANAYFATFAAVMVFLL